MAKIDILKDEDFSRMLLNAFAAVPYNDPRIVAYFADMPKSPDPGLVDVQVFVDGIEVPFVNTLRKTYNLWVSEIGEMVRAEARGMLKAKVSGLIDKLHDLENQIEFINLED